MSVGKMLGLFFVSGFLLIQFIPYERTNPKSDPSLEIKAPNGVKAIFERSCYDCHSNKTKWPWYSAIAPAKWFVARDVSLGRQWLNFSEWESYGEEKKSKLKKLIFISVGRAMPPGKYVKVHPEAALSDEDREMIREWTGVTAEDILNRPKRYWY